MADIYDSAFRTILNDCSKLIIPVINISFGEHYTGNERITFFPNEHFIDQQNAPDEKRITDTNFAVHGIVRKTYHWECQSTPDSRILIRLFEYDAQIALDQGEIAKEAEFSSYETEPSMLETLKNEYREMIERLDRVVQDGRLSDFDRLTLLETAKDVINEIAKKYQNVVKGMDDVMGGALLETNARKIKNEGIAEKGIKIFLNLLSSGIPEIEAQRLAEIDDELVERALRSREG